MLLSSLLQSIDPISVNGATDRPIEAVTHDSRAAGPEDLFVAIQGENVDARKFVPDLDIAAVVAEGTVQSQPQVTVIQVRDTRKALAELSATMQQHPGRSIPVVGITGTNGKTTTTWMIEAITDIAGWKTGVIGTTGHRIGATPIEDHAGKFTTPESPTLQGILAHMRDEGCRSVAMEVSSIGLALRRVDGIPFKVVVFTSFSRDHLDFHNSMEDYLQAKRRLFSELVDPNGTAVLCMDDPAWQQLKPHCKTVWTTGQTPKADIQAVDINASLKGTEATIHTPAGTGRLRLPMLGVHNLQNALGAVGAGLALGLNLNACLTGLASLPRVPGRLEPIPNDHGIHVFVDYAHTPDALEQVLKNLRSLCEGQLHVVFGCGGDRDPGKRPEMGKVASEIADSIVVTSDNPRSEPPTQITEQIATGIQGPHQIIVDRKTAIFEAIRQAKPGDVVLIAGKGHETTQTGADGTIQFDDRTVATLSLSRWTATHGGNP